MKVQESFQSIRAVTSTVAGRPFRPPGNRSPLRLRRRSGTYRCAGLSYTDHPEATILGLGDPRVWERSRSLAISAQVSTQTP